MDERPEAAVAAEIAARHFGIAGEIGALPGEVDHNYLVATRRERYVLRITPLSEDADRVRLQNEVMRHVASAGIALETPHPVAAGSGADLVETAHGLARMLSWVDGTPYARQAPADRNASAIGAAVGAVLSALADFPRPAAASTGDWDLGRAAATIRSRAPAITGTHRRATAVRAADGFESAVEPLWPSLPKQQIHNDINDMNLLVADDGSVGGLVDFGDTVFSAAVVEVAVAATYLMLGQDDPVATAAAMIGAVAAVRSFQPAEAAVLLPMIRARLSMSVAISASRAGSGNPHHLVSEEQAWDLLERLDTADDAAVGSELAAAAGHRVPARSLRRDLLAARSRLLLPSLSLHYEEPLVVMRGRGAHLYDERARRYLDCVNNVAHVGHANAAVAAAADGQSRVLSTNTRYLHPAITEYAARLAATLPDRLDTVVLVNSGSEANELAIRMARTHTGADGVAVFESGYHGNTTTTVAVSHYKFAGPGGTGAETWVTVLPLPDPYRTGYKGAGAAAAYADTVSAVLATGRGPAALLAESIIGCGGQIVPEAGVLAAAYDGARAAGALCIADEVQTGVGRVGSAFWAFEMAGVVPDIVTMGKPLGNGYPLGAVVTTRAIAESFANGMEYFNTFGGNPVSARVGLAVLDEIETRGLQAHALEVGAHLEEELLAIADQHNAIGDIRGAGLFLGIEFVADRVTRSPAPELTREIVEHALRDGVLLSIDGPHHNVVKIKPPLVFSPDDVATLASALDAALRACT